MASSSVPAHLNFITGNKNKLAEVQAILSGVIELRNQNVDLVEIQGTVEEVTKDKARRAAEAMLSGFDDKSAQAVCTFGYCEGPGKEAILFQGRTDGKLVESRGSTVFGQTYAEMDKSEKNKISHRAKALDKLKEWLANKVEST
ncbi:ham1 family protein [Stemphylium lycopersici]|nr:ham1 family protein [Stemphylium lycopersici]